MHFVIDDHNDHLMDWHKGGYLRERKGAGGLTFDGIRPLETTTRSNAAALGLCVHVCAWSD